MNCRPSRCLSAASIRNQPLRSKPDRRLWRRTAMDGKRTQATRDVRSRREADTSTSPVCLSERRFELGLDGVVAGARGQKSGIVDAELDVRGETPVKAEFKRERVA